MFNRCSTLLQRNSCRVATAWSERHIEFNSSSKTSTGEQLGERMNEMTVICVQLNYDRDSSICVCINVAIF